MDKWLTPPLLVSLLAVAIAIVNSYYARKQVDKNQIKDLEERQSDSESELKVLKKQIDLFWGTVERQMAKKFRDDE